MADIKAWLAEKPGGGSPIFWLDGISGIGKSTVAKTMAEFAEEQKILGASFFSRTDGRTNLAVFFNTIAYQLAIVFPAFNKALTDTKYPTNIENQVLVTFHRRNLVFDSVGQIARLNPPE